MKNTARLAAALTLSTTLAPTLAMAHTGHDHAAPEATLIHMGVIAAPIAAAALYFAWRTLKTGDK